ncbi:unnamed protein product [Miscanthus lutarioriparius]|uniref:Uncharacterized protein n=1 Tax=Miscanthus lutarioriparius TaxID=422564 RepID=A0A811QWW6_9POAL|nr:unnamed protein product [Miscanthus lutarioriparius]
MPSSLFDKPRCVVAEELVKDMANRPKCHLTENLLVLLSYTATIVAVCTLPQPVHASAPIFAVNKLCIGPNYIVQACFSGSISLVAVPGAKNKNARALLLNSQDLSGPLPTGLGFSNLSYLALANNKLTGPIPPSIGHLHDSVLEVVLLNNQLSGCLPHELGMLTKASVIDAGMNQLTGPIPTSFSCLSRVEQLNLAGNRLYGRVPDALCKLAGPAGRLANLTLRGNYFTSVGPACAALIKDGVLDVRNNCIPGFYKQRRPAECVAFQSHRKKCPEMSTQVLCPAAAAMNAATLGKRRARDYSSYVTYATLHE